MKRILALLIAMVLTAAFTIGGTVAYVNATAESSGDVTVTVDDAQPLNEQTVLFSDGIYWEPGHMQLRHIHLTGERFSYKLKFTADVESQKLAEAMEVWYCPSANITEGMSRQEVLKVMTYAGTLAELITDSEGVFLSSNLVETEVSVAVALRMKESAGNIFMGLAITDLCMVVETAGVSQEG